MPKRDNNLSARPLSMKELLTESNKQYITPDFQREFEWEQKQFEQLLRDVQTIIERDDTHFFGQIIVVEESQGDLTHVQIIDGQQRITTTIILMCVLRDIFREDNVNRENKIDEVTGVLNVSDKDANKYRRLRLENHETSDLILEDVFDGKTDNLTGTVGECYNFYKSRFSDLSFEMIDDIRRALLHNIRVIKTTTGSLSSAYQIFQTQNDRGQPLSTIDLAKSITFEAAATTECVNSDHVKNTWIRVVDSLSQTTQSGSKRAITHILGISNYNCPIDAYPETFIRRYKDIIRSGLDEKKKTVTDLMNFLDTEKELYLEANFPKKTARRESLGEDYARRARQLRYKNPYAGAVLYYLYKNYNEDRKRLYEILDLLILLNVRLNLNDVTKAGQRNPMYDATKSVVREDNPVADIKSIIRNETPSDAALREFVSTREFKQNDITRLVLARLENDHFRENSARVRDFSIEHVAPRSAFSDGRYTSWRSKFNHDEGRFDQFAKRIGNLTILNGSLNARAGTDPFEEKKQQYNSSEYGMTNDLCEYDNWTYTQIRTRSENIAELIVDSWSIN